MATELASAYLTLIPTLKNAGKQISAQLDGVDVSGSGRKMGKQIGDGISTQMDASVKRGASGVASTLKGVAGAAAGAFAAIGFGQLVSEAAAATDATQKFKSTLDFAGLDTSKIDALTASTREYADQTVYELSDIQNITAQLAANSVKDYDKLAEAAGNLNAVAGGNAETYSRVGLVLTQTAGAGKLTTENWNQLADAIPGASGKLQEAMLKNGAYTGNFREAMEKGEISAEEFNQAIMELGFEDAAVNAAKSTATFEGAFGNLKAEVVGGLSDIMTKLQPAITGAMNGVTAVVGPAFKAVGGAVQFAIDHMDRIIPVVAAVVGAFATFKAVQAAAGLLSALSGPLMAAKQGLVAFKLACAVNGPVSALGGAVRALGGVLGTALGGPVGIAAAAIAALVGAIIVGYNTNETFRSAIQSAWAQIQALAAAVWPSIQGVITGVMQIIQAVAEAVWPVVQQAFTIAGEAIKGVVDAVFPFIQTVITTVMGVIQSVINIVLAAINGDWSGVWEGIKGLASTVWEGIKNVVSSGIEAVKGVIGSVLQSISSIWDATWNAVASFFGGIWDGLKQAASDGIAAVYDTIIGIKDKITGFFSGAGQWLVDAGRSILQGLWDGISGAMGWLGDQLAGIGDFIVQHKGPPSYDRVMLAENGELIMRGLINGIEGQKPALASALRSVSADINAAPMLGAKSARGGSTVNNYYTIEGVTYAEGSDEGRAVAALFDVIGRTRAAYAASI